MGMILAMLVSGIVVFCRLSGESERECLGFAKFLEDWGIGIKGRDAGEGIPRSEDPDGFSAALGSIHGDQ